MKAPKFLALIVALTTLPSYADQADVQLGRQWAKCSQQAKILQRLSKDADESKKLKKVSALLRIYSEAAAGKSASLAEESKTEAEFIHRVPLESPAKVAVFAKAFTQQAQVDAKVCSDSFEKHGSRFDEEVRQILKRSRIHTSAADHK